MKGTRQSELFNGGVWGEAATEGDATFIANRILLEMNEPRDRKDPYCKAKSGKRIRSKT